MAARAFTVLMFESATMAGGVLIFTPGPGAGLRWVVRDIVAANDDPEPRGLGGIFVRSSGAAFLMNVGKPDARSRNTYRWEGRQVIDHPDALEVFPRDDGWTIRITGYELSVA